MSSGSTNIYVNDARTYQTITGFGAAFTDSSTYLLADAATSSQLTSALTNVFSPASGIGLSFMRIPMGASDFIEPTTFYTYDDRPSGQTDPNLTNFSVGHGQLYTIPIIKDALAVNPNIKLFANPWSPPAWMKTNGWRSRRRTSRSRPPSGTQGCSGRRATSPTGSPTTSSRR